VGHLGGKGALYAISKRGEKAEQQEAEEEGPYRLRKGKDGVARNQEQIADEYRRSSADAIAHLPGREREPGVGNVVDHIEERDVRYHQPDRFGLEKHDRNGETSDRQNKHRQEKELELRREFLEGRDKTRSCVRAGRYDI